jgi:hypothetical protein
MSFFVSKPRWHRASLSSRHQQLNLQTARNHWHLMRWQSVGDGLGPTPHEIIIFTFNGVPRWDALRCWSCPDSICGRPGRSGADAGGMLNAICWDRNPGFRVAQQLSCGACRRWQGEARGCSRGPAGFDSVHWKG